MESTATTVAADPPEVPHEHKCPWNGTREPTLAMHDLVQYYLDCKGIDYCVELKFFMLDVEG